MSRAERAQAEAPGDAPSSPGRDEAAPATPAAGAPFPPRQALAPLRHGGRSEVALAPQVKGVRRELCRRLGVSYRDLSLAGKEAVDLYSRARAKLAAIDRYLETHPMLTEQGEPIACLPIYATLLNTSSRLLGQVLAVIEATGRADDKLRRHLEETYGGDE